MSFDPKEAFKKIKSGLLKKEIEHRWVPVENYHCTLNFLGETDPLMLPELKNLMRMVADRHAPFKLDIHGAEAFPETRMGRVIYVGIQNSRELRSLQEDCLEVLREKFHPEERAYIPHLTIARLRNPKNLSDILSPVKKHHFGTLDVPYLVLYESKSGGAFPVYVPLEKFRLAAHE